MGVQKRGNVKIPGFFVYKEDLTINDDLLCFKERIVMPTKMQNQSLKEIHLGHQGINRKHGE